MGENICKWCDWQGLISKVTGHLIEHNVKQPKKQPNNPIKKMGRPK